MQLLSNKTMKKFRELGIDTGPFIMDFTPKIEVDLTPIYNELLPIYKEALDTDKEHILYEGGRGGAKSSQHADIKIIESYDFSLCKTIFLFTREYQNSIDESSYSLVKSRVEHYNLSKDFRFIKNKIINKVNNVEFIFKGLQNPNSIKSIPNISRALFEECETSKFNTLDIVIPSIRRMDGKPVKICYLLNPFKTTDDVKAYVKMQKAHLIKKINITDLPMSYQNPVLLEQMEADRRYNPDYYRWKWLGEPYPSRALEPFINLHTVETAGRTGEVYAFLDPSFKGLDTTALTIAWINNDKVVIYGKVWHRAWNECLTETIYLLKKYNVDYFYYEDNSLGTSPKDIFYENKVGALPKTSKGNKVDRIYRVAPIIDNLEFIQDDQSYNYIKQVKAYSAEKSIKPKQGDYDDAPDSLASCLMVMGVIDKRPIGIGELL